MSEYQLTDVAKEELDFECSECGTTEMPELSDREDSSNPLADHRIEVPCVACGNKTWSDVWDRDVERVEEYE